MKRIIIFIVCSVLLTCTSDNEEPIAECQIPDLTLEQLQGTWVEMGVRYQDGSTYDYEPDAECGFLRFFDIIDSNYYDIMVDDDCTFSTYTKSITIDRCYFSISNNSYTRKYKVLSISNDQMEYIFDANNDGDFEDEEYIHRVQRYEPPAALNFYQTGFHVALTNKINMSWREYSGWDNFDKYEIYRYPAACDVGEPELLATFEDIEAVEFTDNNPPFQESICYKLSVYADNELAVETMRTVNPSDLQVPNITNFDYTIVNDSIRFTWDSYGAPYFSHIKIKRSESAVYPDWIVDMATVEDEGQLSITVESGYFSPQKFRIQATNLFGNESNWTSLSVSHPRPELIPTGSIRGYVFHPELPYLYFVRANTLYIWDYEDHQIVHEAYASGNSRLTMKLFQTEQRDLLCVVEVGDFMIYDGQTLQELNSVNATCGTRDFEILHDNILVTLGSNSICTRRLSHPYDYSVTEIEHGNNFGYYSYPSILPMENNRILVTNNEWEDAKYYEVTQSGVMQEAEVIPIPVHNTFYKAYSESNNFIVNTAGGSIYDLENYEMIANLPDSIRVTTISPQQNKILGTYYTMTDYNGREVRRIFSATYPDFEVVDAESKGYSFSVFNRSDGRKFSFSSGTPFSYYPVHGHRFFVEEIE